MSQEYEVLYDWEPENPEDLRIFAGEQIIILEKHDHGWWLGSIDRQGEVIKGYFPKNYVKERAPTVTAPKPPPRPTSMPHDVAKLTNDLSAMATAPAVPDKGPAPEAGRVFSIKSLSAFDDLMAKGYAVECAENSGGAYAKIGDEVTLSCTAMTWDGALGGAKEFASGTLVFILGRATVVPGLEQALLAIPIGQSATVTCSPSMAYGNAGFPPSVPPKSFVVFMVTLLAACVPKTSSDSVQGPSSLFVADLPKERRASVQSVKRDRIMLAEVTTSGSA